MKVLVGGIIQESNTFSPMRSTMENFRRHHLVMGDDMLAMRTENEIKGFLQAASEQGVGVIPTFSANAVSSGVFKDTALSELLGMVEAHLQSASRYDGVYFALHGAMAAEGCDDVEGELIERIRSHIGKAIPLVVSLDLHANVTRRMVNGVDGLVGFRTYPHTDFVETGYRSAQLLFSIMRKELRPCSAFRKLPMIVPAENSQTSSGPFADLWKEAENGEAEGHSVVTSLFPVQPWLDVEEMGISVVVVGKEPEHAEREADRMAELFWQKRREFEIELFQVKEIAERALQSREEDGLNRYPYIISDSSDSPGAGATGDSNFVLRELLELGVHNRLACLLTMVDAPAVAKAIEAGVGCSVTMEVGYTLNPNRAHGKPVQLTGTVRKIGDGRFQLQGGYAKHTTAHMGRCVVLDIGNVSLLITEKPTFTGDPAMYRSMGLEPSKADIVLVKSANQFRADYERLSDRIFILDTPGCSPANVRRLPYSKLPRPFYPFDDDFIWSGGSVR
ncbi:M81 family metallopeptidase [Paenibacillus allorhizosphaerae]|uniref:M81 family metallopeptidase n=1 Tax=Paenibacillus allorhizosphaerae TaxID=2849866 RepID=A0ABM8VB54_9BACL|nr:M81 family metallopeptidase [Paenibacillus allorhizosphaerae]CAG7618376.1 hypothetical protein PAECIP111802_00512 [Paenibacillus allorhizosphaerae]